VSCRLQPDASARGSAFRLRKAGSIPSRSQELSAGPRAPSLTDRLIFETVLKDSATEPYDGLPVRRAALPNSTDWKSVVQRGVTHRATSSTARDASGYGWNQSLLRRADPVVLLGERFRTSGPPDMRCLFLVPLCPGGPPRPLKLAKSVSSGRDPAENPAKDALYLFRRLCEIPRRIKPARWVGAV
jgi:hypothetical protein